MSAGAWLVIVAAGRGERLGRAEPKAFVPLAGRPLVAWSLAAAGASAAVRDAVVVADPGAWSACEPRLPEAARALVRAVVAGGAVRRDSVRHGLAAIRERESGDPVVLIHDAARPLAPPELFAAVAAAAQAGPAIAARPIADTVKEVAGDGTVRRTLDRGRLRIAQTPQGARLSVLERAHAAAGSAATDDAALIEALGEPVHVVEGPPSNFKITDAGNLALAEAWVAAGGAPWLGPPRPTPPDRRAGASAAPERR